MSTILNSTIITSAKDAVATYVSTATDLNSQLGDVIDKLTSSNFTGDASQGYKEFYTKYVLPAITENLTDEGTSITSSIKNMLDSIEEQLINTIDTQLGDFNRNPQS